MIKTRRKEILNIVNNLLINFGGPSYPLNIFLIYNKLSYCKIVSYTTHMNKYNLSLKETILFCGSKDGCSIYHSKLNKYIVYFNNLTNPKRQLWTLAHELGHIILNHHKDNNNLKIFRNSLTHSHYNYLEEEANFFAGILLAHPVILNKLDIKTEIELQNYCNLSSTAAAYRFNFFNEWKRNPIQLSSNNILINNFKIKKKCLHCHSTYTINLTDLNNIKYCPLCGSNHITIGGNTIMKINDGIKLDNNSKAMECPQCGNTEVFSDDPAKKYCKICGLYLINHCTCLEDIWEVDDRTDNMKLTKNKCGTKADGNARYCVYCGSETTFYKSGILPYITQSTSNLDDDDIPF